MSARLRVYLVDDEALAVRRLRRLLEATGRVEIAGATTSPEDALAFLRRDRVDALFLDVQMPGMTGFELLARLGDHPPVVFTTAFDRFALQAFEVDSLDYLLKPIEPEALDRALSKLERFGAADGPDFRRLAEQLSAGLASAGRGYPERVASRVGDRVQFVELAQVSHFCARDKLTYAVTSSKSYVVDQTIAELEARLDPRRFVRIHRATLVNVAFVAEVRSLSGGRLAVRLKEAPGLELPVARDRARDLRERLGF